MKDNTKLYTVKEAADYLNLKESTVRKLIFNKKIEVVKIGWLVRISQEVLDDVRVNGIKN